MRRAVACLTLLLTLTLAIGAAPDSPTTKPQNPRPRPEPVVIAGQSYQLELAADPKTRERGMSGRKGIAERGGMLFVFPRDQVMRFWMKDCVIPIDIAFVDRRGIITALHRMKPDKPRSEHETMRAYEYRLKRYSSRRAARFAIELKAGSLDALELKIGQRIPLDAARLIGIAAANERRIPGR